jgi:hypothetical protein
MRGIRAKRRPRQTYEASGEWSGYTVREGARGWIVDLWSRTTGERTGWRVVVEYGPSAERGHELVRTSDDPYQQTLADRLLYTARLILAGTVPGRVLRRGHVVR